MNAALLALAVTPCAAISVRSEILSLDLTIASPSTLPPSILQTLNSAARRRFASQVAIPRQSSWILVAFGALTGSAGPQTTGRRAHVACEALRDETIATRDPSSSDIGLNVGTTVKEREGDRRGEEGPHGGSW